MKANTKHLLALTTTQDEITDEVKPLFAFPVDVCSRIDKGSDVQFENAAPSGADYKVQYVDEATGQVFEYAERLRGVKVGDEFKAIDPDSIAAIDKATKVKTMIALGSAPLDEVRAKYADRINGTYFLQSPSKGGSPKAYRLTKEALLPEMTPSGKVKRPARAIVTKRTARSRQKLAFIYADAALDCLVMCEVTFAALVREPDEQVLAPNTADVEQAQVDMARKVIDNMPDGMPVFEAEVDEAVALRTELTEQAIAGKAIEPPVPVAETVAEDELTAQLEASIG